MLYYCYLIATVPSFSSYNWAVLVDGYKRDFDPLREIADFFMLSKNSWEILMGGWLACSQFMLVKRTYSFDRSKTELSLIMLFRTTSKHDKYSPWLRELCTNLTWFNEQVWNRMNCRPNNCSNTQRCNGHNSHCFCLNEFCRGPVTLHYIIAHNLTINRHCN